MRSRMGLHNLVDPLNGLGQEANGQREQGGGEVRCEQSGGGSSMVHRVGLSGEVARFGHLQLTKRPAHFSSCWSH